MTKSIFNAAAIAALLTCLGLTSSSNAQDNILAEMYGRGVHAFYSGNYNDAQHFLTTAIDNNIDDPRAYYFRGIVAQSQGRTHDAETDWKAGAEMEASGNTNVAVGRSLSRFQGSARLKLEQIRRLARLQAMSGGPTRSQSRLNEIKAAEQPLAATVSPPPVPRSSRPITALPLPPSADNPFADDVGMATGQPKIEKDDALAGAMDPLPTAADVGVAVADAGAAGDAPATGADPFTGGADDGPDPFSDDTGANPFGGGADAGGGAEMNDPFADDPFK